MKLILLLFFAVTGSCALSQKPVLTTENFTIEGKVKKSMTISLNDLASYPSSSIDSIVITNHLHERKPALNKVKGVLLKDILEKAEIDEEKPKILSEYYFVCIASDNYKIVFSWNEIFNNTTGRFVFILTEQDGKPASALDNRVALIAASDEATGRRYVKGLHKIIVERVK
jgi:hypothetical protein